MTWTNPSAVLTKFRAQLVACPACAAAGMVQARFHYPNIALTGVDNDEIPACLLAEGVQQRDRYAEGAIPLISGSLSAVFYFPLSVAADAGYLETFARQVVYELGAQFSGLSWKNLSAALASNPSPGARAAEETEDGAQFRTIILTANYGLSR